MKFLKSTHKLLIVLTFLAYASVWISPQWFWLVGFIPFSIPFFCSIIWALVSFF